jgi:Tol biopolymer transport system component
MADVVNDAFGGSKKPDRPELRKLPSPRNEMNLEEIPFKIVHETYHKTNRRNNWELHIINADGSGAVNLTRTPYIDEMYPHVSPDGTKISFVVDKGTREYATSGLFIYDLQTRRHRQHPNKDLLHIYAICWSPDGNWFVGVVHGGVEHSDTILAFGANGKKLFDLERWGVKGCRPDFSLDGTKMVWGETDWNLCIGDFDDKSGIPRITNIRDIVNCLEKSKVYHVDISPDGKYIAFSYGSFNGGQQVGGKARGWNICVADMTGKWVKITTDGNHNKEPDWVPVAIPDNQLVAELKQK